jgi:hypothetical protein
MESLLMPNEQPPAFLAIREALLRMADSERLYLLRWLRRWVDERGALKRSAFLYPKPIDWKAIEDERKPRPDD